MPIAVRGFRVFVLASLLVAPALAAAQETQSKSATLAGELVRLLDAMKLDSVAAQQDAEHYVGALYYPGTQLLVIGGKYPGTARMKDLLGKRDYREVYLDLSSATEQKTRVFIMDLGANGLRFRREENQPFDTADVAGRSLSFDGEWNRAKLSEQEYRKVFDETDAQYSQMLQALITALKKPS